MRGAHAPVTRCANAFLVVTRASGVLSIPPMRASLGIGVAVLTVAVALGAWAQGSCPDVSELCPSPTGPCYFSDDVVIATPCLIDVRPRDFVISRKVKVEGGGTFSVSGASVSVSVFGGKIDASGEDGAHVSLIATDLVSISAPIDVSGTSTAGSLTLTGGGVISSRSRIKADGGAGGGTVTATAGDYVSITDISARSSSGPGGTVILRGGTGASAGGVNIVGSKLSSGGTVDLSSASGQVSVGTIRARSGGNIRLVADDGRVLLPDSGRIKASGDSPGPILIESTSADVRLHGKIKAKGRITGGAVTIRAATDAFLQTKISAVGKETGGSIRIEAPTVEIEQPVKLDASGRVVGGEVRVVAGTVATTEHTKIAARGGGRIQITASTGSLALSGLYLTKGVVGGTIEATAATDLTATGRFIAGPGGCIALAAGGVRDVSTATADGPIQDDCPGSASGAFLDGSSLR